MTVTDTQPMIGNIFDIDTARARRSDPLTSHEAADTNDVEASIGLVLATLRKLGPMHDELLVTHIQGAAAYGDAPKYTEQRIRTARAALVGRGLVRDTGTKTRTSRNRNTTVWAVAE